MSRRAAFIALALLGGLYALIVVPSWNLGHLDFGDGNYMYISWRAANGAVIYRDILAPQPPVHFLIGVCLAEAGALMAHPLYAFRLYSLLLHIATMGAVYLAAVRTAEQALRKEEDRGAEDRRRLGIRAAAIYMLLPLGFWWTLGYQSEPTEVLFQVLAYWALLRWDRAGALAAGVLSGLAVLTNMTALPYALAILVYLLCRERRLALWFGLPALGIAGAVIGAMEAWTGAAFENIFLNQVGSFPRPEFLPEGETPLTYAVSKLLQEGGDVLRLEGGFVALAALGLVMAAGSPHRHREFLVWYGWAALFSIVFVTKGGTVDYIFTLGEPWVAIHAALVLHLLLRRMEDGGRTLAFRWSDLTGVGVLLCLAAAFLALTLNGLIHTHLTLRQRTYELSEAGTLGVRSTILARTNADDEILAPPHYAFVAQRRIAEDYSELLLWTLKYMNEMQDEVEGEGRRVVGRIAAKLEAGAIPLAVIDMRQTWRIPEIRRALEAHYEPLREEPLRTLNTELQFFVPKGAR